MQPQSHKKQRRREVWLGLITLLAAFSYVASLLLDFNFVSPYATLQEDLVYLSNHLQNHQISVWAWLITAFMTFVAIPFYLLLFHRRIKVLPYLNALMLLGASVGFLMMGLTGLGLFHDLTAAVQKGIELADEQTRLDLLSMFNDEQFYRRVGSSFLGTFVFGLGLTKFWLRRYPLVSSILLFLSGPTMIYFNWTDPEHIIRTAAMAGIVIGMTIFCVRLINKGM
ncbi:MAG: hypothetical protein E4H10_05250 [Bacteroidia bacterium]|nr:MAG: hypothetical protein E4H10_05250 [Bacteroidia bacterium]